MVSLMLCIVYHNFFKKKMSVLIPIQMLGSEEPFVVLQLLGRYLGPPGFTLGDGTVVS